ncbi:P-loop containing nucleoside triphosphate hydrolase protein [Gorgonomyces haynaldii]|nr:P-loop containing nucleoside triphosphate hydrolase protein [Gorgonomyces haynaldii]
MACFYDNSTIGLPIFPNASMPCPPGYYCKDYELGKPETIPRICPPSSDCVISRLQIKLCPPQGPSEPTIVSGGYYAPSQSERLVCPEGYFCPAGSATPQKCDWLSVCPEGTRYQRSLNGVAIMIVLDLLIVLLYVHSHRDRIFDRMRRMLHMSVKLKTTAPETAKRDETVDALVSAFRKGMGGRDIRTEFKFKDMELEIDGKKLLQGVTGCIRHSRMTAIMGPSGAGKTTFMNVLRGKVSRTGGTLWINGKEAEIHQFKKLMGFVPQDDIMIRELTVRQVLVYSARIRAPRSWTTAEIDEHVDRLLVSLNLAHVQHTKIGDEVNRGISGGQRKRVNIGMEMAAVPVCIFLDEPTSGLDATAALEVTEILKQITRLGITVVSVIHQPRVEIFESFDDVLLIGKGGRTCYFGPCDQIKPYFESLGYIFHPAANPADVIMDILSGKGNNPSGLLTIDDLVERALKSDSKPVEKTTDDNFHLLAPALVKDRGASFLTQMIWSHNRSLLQQVATPESFALECLVGLLAGLIMGTSVLSANDLYIGTLVPPFTTLSSSTVEWVIPQLGFFLAAAAALAASPAGVKVFSEERVVYWREASSGHDPTAYFIGKSFSVLYRLCVTSLHFAVIFHVLARPLISFQKLYVVILALFFGVYGLSSAISMIVARENAALLAVVICLFNAVFTGFGVTLVDGHNWGLSWLFDMSFYRWAAEAIYTESVLPFEGVYLVYKSAEKWGYTLNRFYYDVGMAVVSGLGWRVVAYVLMRAMNRSKQQ